MSQRRGQRPDAHDGAEQLPLVAPTKAKAHPGLDPEQVAGIGCAVGTRKKRAGLFDRLTVPP
jgi:hypothetical protein